MPRSNNLASIGHNNYDDNDTVQQTQLLEVATSTRVVGIASVMYD